MKYDISLCVPGLPFNGDSLDQKSLGGSETAGLCVARELAALGHRVYMFCNTDQPGTYDDVTYYPLAGYEHFSGTTPHDVTIVQRSPQLLRNRTAARINLLWCHDLALGRQRQELRGTMWNIDRVLVLSEYMAGQYRDVYDLPESVLWTTRNGIDLDRFDADPEPRDPKHLIYSARPERGLDVLLKRIMPRLLEADSEIKLTIYGYDNQVPHLEAFYAELGEAAKRLGPNIRHGGCLTKRELYKIYQTAGIYVYPTPGELVPEFAEISCISAMEAQAAGLPIVTSARGALPETVAPGAGVLIEGSPETEKYVEAFCGEVLRYISNEAAGLRSTVAGIERARGLSWTGVVEEWTERLDRLFGELNDDRTRLTSHFLRRSDVEAARRAIAGVSGRRADELRARIDREYAFSADRDTIREHYRAGGVDTDERLSSQPDPDALFRETREPRIAQLEELLRAHPSAINILDFGCGHGWTSVYLSNKLSNRRFVGVDVDPGAVKWSGTYANRYAKQPHALAFIEGDEDVDLADSCPDGGFDCLIMSEVLEHLIDPWSVIEKLERWVKPGGMIIITVPYGPSEFATYNWERFRNHLWEFDLHDIHDLFGAKKDLDVRAQAVMNNAATNEPVGYHLIVYTADGARPGPIDWDRKLALQRPRETVSVSLIAGGDAAEETLAWCLRSVRWVADEIVIADCGMSTETRRIARRHGARIVRGVNPLQVGFEVARNRALRACRCDWVLWIDCDEKLLDPQCTDKYLRSSLFDGYSIRQHHFSVDAGFKPDLPVRLFRREPRLGQKPMRFYGMIHEHPERGINKGAGEVVILADVNIAHVGYLTESTRQVRFWRNHPLLQADIKKYPDRILQKHFILRDNSLLNTYEVKASNGAITEGMRNRALESVKLYREHFLGKPGYTNADALEYYSQALEILGEGVDVMFDLQASRDGQGDALNGHGTRARFANAEEAEKEISWRLRQKLVPLETTFW
jgi:glycosyltransferase involved in cell wall biosynthesis/SAM-dependent methyltransferase